MKAGETRREGGRKCGGTCLWGLAPQMAEAGKTTENRPLHRQNWVRIRRVTPPRKSAFIVGALWALHPTTKGDEARFPSEGQPAAIQEAALRKVIGSAPEQGVEQQIRDLEGQINAAVVSGDLLVFDRLLADDFTHTNQSGIFRTKAQWLANHKPGQSPYVAYEVDDMKIRVYGDTTVVTVRTTPKGRDSKGNPITGQYRYLRVWSNRDGRWRAVAFQGTRIAQ